MSLQTSCRERLPSIYNRKLLLIHLIVSLILGVLGNVVGIEAMHSGTCKSRVAWVAGGIGGDVDILIAKIRFVFIHVEIDSSKYS